MDARSSLALSTQSQLDSLMSLAAASGTPSSPAPPGHGAKANAGGAPVPPALRAACEEAMEVATRKLTSTLAPLLESLVARIGNLEEKVEEMAKQQQELKEGHAEVADAVNNSVATKLATLESATREVMRSMQLLKDKTELAEAQQEP